MKNKLRISLFLFFQSLESLDDQKSILVKIAKAFADQLLSDIVLIVGNVRYPAHRVILCASSEVFQVFYSILKNSWSDTSWI